MEIKSMNMTNVGIQHHKEIAMQFLLKANNELEDPLPPDLVEKVYDIFAHEPTGSHSYQKLLEHLIIQKEQKL